MKLVYVLIFLSTIKIFSQPAYNFSQIDLPASPSISNVDFYAINDFNEVAASGYINSDQYYVLRWKKTSGYSIAYTSPSGSFIFPSSINKLGTITANRYSFSGDRGIIISNSNFISILPAGTGSGSSYAWDSNDSNKVVGFSSGNAVLWDNGNITDILTNAEAFAINDSGDVVYYSNGNTFVKYNNGTTIQLPVTEWRPSSINNRREVVGFGIFSSQPMLWSEAAGLIQLPDLGGFQITNPVAINDSGIIVGHVTNTGESPIAVLWYKDGSGNYVVKDLNDYASQSSGIIRYAEDINNKGSIVGTIYTSQGLRGYILEPPRVRKPLFIVPGIAGTYSKYSGSDQFWVTERGIVPELLQIDPLARVYDDIIKTFQNVGYVLDEDLFVVNYDWRVIPGPLDNNFDGHVDGISAASITSRQFKYGVDYLGWFLKQACETWRLIHNGEELDSIDIISHSTGGLVARTYIQSDAYGGVYDNTNNYKLPKVRNLVMIGVPNRGASKPWNPLNDNWIADPAYRFVLSKMINRAYQKVKQGATINGPDYSIDLQSIMGNNNQPDSILFIQKYVPTIKYLLATYDFIDFDEDGVANYTNVNSDPDKRNSIILDLNNGLDINQNGDPNKFLDSSFTAIIYGIGVSTPSLVEKRSDFEINSIHRFTDFTRTSVLPGTVWYNDISSDNNGDGTVPTVSSAGQFTGDNRANLIPIVSGNHTEIVSQPNVQSIILNLLNVPFNQNQISTGSSNNYDRILSVISDPVDLVITDGLGRRLGYTEDTDVLTEIPNSIWFGNADGIGYVFGPVEEPITLQLTGLGENYYVMVSVEDSGKSGGVVLEGFLADGEVIIYQITLDPVSVEEISSVIPQNFALAQNYPNPFNPSTKISWQSPVGSHQTLKVYDVLGNEVATLVDEFREAGRYEITFDASNLSSGIYFYRVQAGSFVETKKMILVK